MSGRMTISWLVVGIPLAWGVWRTVLNASLLVG